MVPFEVIDSLPPQDQLGVQRLSSDWIFVTEDISARWATAVMLLLDPGQPFSGPAQVLLS
jgi:hypothetical protein